MKIVGKYILRILFFLILVSFLLYLYLDKLTNFFFTNQTLNTIILLVIAFGIVYIFRQIKDVDIKITTIARGVSVGNELEYTDEVTLGRSILKRIPFENSLKT